jgi:chromate transporter
MARGRGTPPTEQENSYFYSCSRLLDKRWRPFSLTKMVSADPGHPVLESPPRPQPRNPSDLFWSFTWLALQGFGGVLAVVQRELVEKKRWMTNEEFVEDWAVAQIMPGPNVVNLSIMIGDRYFGLRGAFAALAGMLTFPLILVLALAVVYAQFSSHPAVAGALRGMGAVAAGLIAGVAIKLFASITRHPLGRPMCVAFVLLTIVTMAVLRWPLWWILPVVGGAACLLTWRKLAP